jgi:hypothetical protein
MLIGILGHAGSGKDTFADRLEATQGFQKIALADPLKRICREVYKFSVEQLWGPSEERNKPDKRYPNGRGGFLTPREALQRLGTEWGRECYEDTWVDYAINAYDRIMNGDTYSQMNGFPQSIRKFRIPLFRKPTGGVIPDVRFKNEVRKIHAHGGIVIRVRRAGVNGDIGSGIKGHASEMEQKSIMDDEVDFVLDVPEGIEAYYVAIDSLYERIKVTGGVSKFVQKEA